MRETKLQVIQEGASAEELQRGTDAALALFERAGIAPGDAAHAAWRMKAENNAGAVSAREFEMAALWDKAACVAADACCAGWPQKPKTVHLQLVDLLEEQVIEAIAPLFAADCKPDEFHDVTGELIAQAVAAMTAHGVPEPIAMRSVLIIVTNLFVEWIGPGGAAALLRHMADKVDAEPLH